MVQINFKITTHYTDLSVLRAMEIADNGNRNGVKKQEKIRNLQIVA